MKFHTFNWSRVFSSRGNDSLTNTGWEVMTADGELFVRFKGKEIRMTPKGEGFVISDFNTPGKLTLGGEVNVT